MLNPHLYPEQANLETPEENESVKSMLIEHGYSPYSFWIGLSDTQEEGTNVWVETGNPLTYKDFAPDYVEDDLYDCKAYSKYYDEVNLRYVFYWYNYYCLSNRYALCEYPPFSGEQQK